MYPGVPHRQTFFAALCGWRDISNLITVRADFWITPTTPNLSAQRVSGGHFTFRLIVHKVPFHFRSRGTPTKITILNLWKTKLYLRRAEQRSNLLLKRAICFHKSPVASNLCYMKLWHRKRWRHISKRQPPPQETCVSYLRPVHSRGQSPVNVHSRHRFPVGSAGMVVLQDFASKVVLNGLGGSGNRVFVELISS